MSAADTTKETRYQPKSNGVTRYDTAKAFFEVEGPGDDVVLYSALFCFGHTCCYCDTDEDEGLWSLYFKGHLARLVFCKAHQDKAYEDYVLVLVLLNEK